MITTLRPYSHCTVHYMVITFAPHSNHKLYTSSFFYQHQSYHPITTSNSHDSTNQYFPQAGLLSHSRSHENFQHFDMAHGGKPYAARGCIRLWEILRIPTPALLFTSKISPMQISTPFQLFSNPNNSLVHFNNRNARINIPLIDSKS